MCGHTGTGCQQPLLDDLVGLSGVLLEPLGQLLIGGPLDHGADRDVPELALGLTFELRVLESDRDDGGEPLPDVRPLHVLVLLLQCTSRPGVLVHHVGEGLLEPFFVHASVDCGDSVGERVDALVVAGVPLERDLDLHRRLLLLERADLPEERLLRCIEVTDVVDDPVLVLEGLGQLPVGSLVRETDLESLVQEGHDLEALGDRLSPELDLLEDARVGPERDGGARSSLRRRTGDLQLADGLAPVLELEDVVVAVAVDLEQQPGGQGVDHRDPHAVETPGDLVAATLAELSPGMEHREHDLGRRLTLVLLHRARGDPTTVVGHTHAAVGQERDVDAVAVPRHRLVDSIVDHLPHQVVEPRRPRRPDVHAGALADRVQTLQHRDVGGVVRGLTGTAVDFVLQRHRRALSQWLSGWESGFRRDFGRARRIAGPSDVPRFQ